jgi:hypothetical protein
MKNKKLRRFLKKSRKGGNKRQIIALFNFPTGNTSISAFRQVSSKLKNVKNECRSIVNKSRIIFKGLFLALTNSLKSS